MESSPDVHGGLAQCHPLGRSEKVLTQVLASVVVVACIFLAVVRGKWLVAMVVVAVVSEFYLRYGEICNKL